MDSERLSAPTAHFGNPVETGTIRARRSHESLRVQTTRDGEEVLATTRTRGAFDSLFRSAESGKPWWVRHADGRRHLLPVDRWLGGDDAATDDRFVDEALLRRCRGRTLDLACGPGRLVGDLRRRGASALGVDVSAEAVALSRSRGAKAFQGNIFDELPHEECWDTVLLLDGNIGIGGEPARVLGRARDIARPGGTLHIEVDPPGTGLVMERLRIESDDITGEWYDWARIDGATLAALAHDAGLIAAGTSVLAGRHFAHFDKRGPRSICLRGHQFVYAR